MLKRHIKHKSRYRMKSRVRYGKFAYTFRWKEGALKLYHPRAKLEGESLQYSLLPEKDISKISKSLPSVKL